MTPRIPIAAALAILLEACVSGGTWASWHDTRARLDARDDRTRDERDTAAGDDASAPPIAGGSPAAATSCDALAALAVRTHPALEAPRARARAALAMARADGSLPAPEGRVAAWDFPIGDPSSADRSGMYMVGLSQALPPADALDADARGDVADAQAALGERDEVASEIAATARAVCVAWAGAATRAERLRAWRALLETMRSVTEARLATSGASLADVARLEREDAGAARALARADADAARAASALRAFLGLSTPDALGPAPALDAEATESPAASDLLARARARRGTIARARARVSAAEARVAGAEARARIPTVMLGASYMQMPGARAGLGVELGIDLPWLWSGAGDRAEAARLEAGADEAELAALERELEVEVASALGELAAARASLAALRDEERPAAVRLEAAVAASYRGGGSSLLEWLDAAKALRELDVEEVEALTEIAALQVELERLAGGSVQPGD